MMGEPFKVGDAVYLVTHGNMWNAKPGVVKSVHKTGNFTIEGEDGQFRRDGGKTGDNWGRERVYLATAEMAAEIAGEKAQIAARNLVYAVAENMRYKSADKHTAIAALLSDELLALLGVTR